MFAPQSSPQHGIPPSFIMNYAEKLEKLDRHIASNPKDYQSVIARMKTFSDAVEHELYLKRIERLKKVEEYRRKYGEK